MTPAGLVIPIVLNASVLLSIGGASPVLNRSTYINVHSTATERWHTNQSMPIGVDYKAGFGRTFTPSGFPLSIHAVNSSSNLPDLTELAAACQSTQASQYSNLSVPYFQQEQGQLYYIYSANTNFWWVKGNINTTGWSPYGDPFLSGYYYSNFVDLCIPPERRDEGVIIEVMNEPLWHLKSVNATIGESIAIHQSVADAIHQKFGRPPSSSSTNGVRVAGPTMDNLAFQLGNGTFFFENFGRFIEEAGSKMDLYSLHLYDAFSSTSDGYWLTRRTGANVEAILDLIEAYDIAVFGAKNKKRYEVSEYGTSFQNWKNILPPRSPMRDWAIIQVVNAKMMQLFERNDLLVKSNPFMIHDGAFWKSSPYPFALLEKHVFKKPGGKSTGWETYHTWSNLIKFYQFWANVSGERLYSSTPDKNLQTALFQKERNSTSFVLIVNSMRDEPCNFTLDMADLSPLLRPSLANITRSRISYNPSLVKITLEEGIPVELPTGGGKDTHNILSFAMGPNECTMIHFEEESQQELEVSTQSKALTARHDRYFRSGSPAKFFTRIIPGETNLTITVEELSSSSMTRSSTLMILSREIAEIRLCGAMYGPGIVGGDVSVAPNISISLQGGVYRGIPLLNSLYLSPVAGYPSAQENSKFLCWSWLLPTTLSSSSGRPLFSLPNDLSSNTSSTVAVVVLSVDSLPSGLVDGYISTGGIVVETLLE